MSMKTTEEIIKSIGGLRANHHPAATTGHENSSAHHRAMHLLASICARAANDFYIDRPSEEHAQMLAFARVGADGELDALDIRPWPTDNKDIVADLWRETPKRMRLVGQETICAMIGEVWTLKLEKDDPRVSPENRKDGIEGEPDKKEALMCSLIDADGLHCMVTWELTKKDGVLLHMHDMHMLFSDDLAGHHSEGRFAGSAVPQGVKH